MKRRYLVLCVMLVIVLLASTIEASAMNTGFLTEDMSEEDRNGAQENNMGKVDMLSSEPKFLLGFANYAISPSGCFAISGSYLTNNLIAVYDADGNYLYGYSINNPGSIAVSWVDDNIAVYFVRSNTIRVLDQNGTVLSEETSDDAMYNQLTANTQVIQDTTYVAKHWLINHETLRWGSYTKLVRISDGVECVLWECVPIFLVCCISMLGVGLVLLTTVGVIRKRNHRISSEQEKN